MANDPEGLVSFEAAGEKYTAVFGFRAMKAVEAHFGTDDEPMPFFQAILSIMPSLKPEELGDQAKIMAASSKLRFSHLGVLFQYALMKHHPDLTEDHIEDIIDEIGLGKVSSTLGDALSAALIMEDADKGGKNPPKPRRRQPTG